MNKFLLAAVAALAALAADPAMAADMGPPVYRPPPPPPPAPVYNWTGFYLNLGGGYGIWDANTSTLNLAGVCIACGTQTVGGRGYLGTAGGGYDYQFNDRFVAGIMADYDVMSLKGTIQDNAVGTPPTTGNLKETSAWAAGLRGGFLITPQIFSYFNGGVAGTQFGGANLALNSGGPTVGTTSSFSKTGWFLGGGTETTLSPFLPFGWFLRSEYRYSSYSSTNVTQKTAAGVPFDLISFKPYVETLTTSIIYKFNWTGQ